MTPKDAAPQDATQGEEPPEAPEPAEGADGPEPGEGSERAEPVEEPSFAPPPPERLEGAVEAMLLAAGDVLSLERLRDLLGLSSLVHVREAVDALGRRWQAAGLSVEVRHVAGGVRVATRPEYAEYVRRLRRQPAADKLSRGLVETLSIVAYRQPVARVEIERIRGVQAGDALRALLDRRLLKVVGRSDQPGHPLLYGTTRRFLTVFGLNDLKDLPSAKDLARM
jgi:segregation and condensation protein B